MKTKKNYTQAIFLLIGLISFVILLSSLFSTGSFSLPSFMATSTEENNSKLDIFNSGSSSNDQAMVTSSSTDTIISNNLPSITDFQLLTPILAPRGIIQAIVASTSALQELGLSNRKFLPSDQGMLFPFQTSGKYGFWMKDMSFSIDIVWINEKKEVIGVATNVSPDTYPNIFLPPDEISYALELNAGAASRFGIVAGTKLVF